MPPVPPAQQDSQAAEHAALAAIVVALLSGASLVVATRTIAAVLAPLGVDPRAVRLSLELVAPHAQQQFGGAGKGTAAFFDPSGLPVPRGSARSTIARTGVARQAGFVLASSRRITADLEQASGAPPLPPGPPSGTTTAAPEPGPAGRNIGETRAERVRAFGEAARARMAAATLDPARPFPVDARVLDQVLERERRYFAQHLAAERTRVEAATRVDAEATRLGVTTLGWHAILDSRTTPECRQANGNNFDVVRPPAQGYPGTLHGGTCRCRPGPPFPGQPLVDEVLLANRS